MGVRFTSIDAIPGEENFHAQEPQRDGNFVYSHLGKMHEIPINGRNGNAIFWKCEIGKERGSVNIEKGWQWSKRAKIGIDIDIIVICRLFSSKFATNGVEKGNREIGTSWWKFLTLVEGLDEVIGHRICRESSQTAIYTYLKGQVATSRDSGTEKSRTGIFVWRICDLTSSSVLLNFSNDVKSYDTFMFWLKRV